ncbi:MAG: molybdopterin molybdotransferase MoeA [Opitutales bacterium]|nr:molybdopterin molybdotransferase MoeA [Opitutales bacterium]
MISVTEAWEHIDACAQALPAENVALDDALGRTLARSVCAYADQPAFDRSAVDGFALAAGQPERESYRLAGEILPGQPAPPAPAHGEALRVCTGSALPAGVAVVMVEDAVTDQTTVRFTATPDTSIVRRQGSSMRAGAALLGKGTSVGPGEIAVLASVGVHRPKVVRSARIVHLVTGSEIVPCSEQPAPGQIRDTNGPLLRALLAGPRCHIRQTLYADEAVDNALRVLDGIDFDLLLVSGGASVGPHDNTPALLQSLGFETVFHRVNVKPGKPLLFARSGNRLAFGIPGNPVSHFACAHLFIRRALARMAGRPPAELRAAALADGAPLRPDARECFWPARVSTDETGRATTAPLPWLDSGDIAALRGVDALVRLPGNREPPSTGATIHFLPLPTPAERALIQ